MNTTVILPAARAAAGLGSAGILILQSPKHDGMPLAVAVTGCGGMGALALLSTLHIGAGIVRDAIASRAAAADSAGAAPTAEPETAAAAPSGRHAAAPAAEQGPAPLIRPPGRRAAGRVIPGPELHGFKVGRRYAYLEQRRAVEYRPGAFERGNGWGL